MRVATGVRRQDFEQGHRQVAVGRQIALACANDAFDRAARRVVVVALNGARTNTFHAHVAWLGLNTGFLQDMAKLLGLAAL